MNQNIFCSKCHRIPSQCCCSVLTMNPDILPTLEEWRLICKMVKHQREVSDDEIKQVYGKYFDAKHCDWLHLQCIREILERAGEK